MLTTVPATRAGQQFPGVGAPPPEAEETPLARSSSPF